MPENKFKSGTPVVLPDGTTGTVVPLDEFPAPVPFTWTSDTVVVVKLDNVTGRRQYTPLPTEEAHQVLTVVSSEDDAAHASVWECGRCGVAIGVAGPVDDTDDDMSFSDMIREHQASHLDAGDVVRIPSQADPHGYRDRGVVVQADLMRAVVALAPLPFTAHPRFLEVDPVELIADDDHATAAKVRARVANALRTLAVDVSAAGGERR